MIDLKNIKLGALPSPHDPRDWTATAAAPVPETIMLKMPPVVSQGRVGNCVLQSVRMAAQMGVPVVIFMTGIKSGWLDKDNMLYNDGAVAGYHDMTIAGCDFHKRGSNTEHMARIRNSWGDGWGDGGYCWMTWEDVFRCNEVWAIYPPEKGEGKFGVDMGYGRWRDHDTPGLYTRMALDGYAKEGIAPLADDPNNTEVTDVITYAKQTDAARLLKAALPYAGATYYRLTSPSAVQAVLYEAYLKQNQTPAPVVTKHSSLRYKKPYLRDRDTVTGKDVSLCQSLLARKGFFTLADGVFGTKTASTVKAFQTAYNLTVDGIVGVKTWAALETQTMSNIPAFIEWVKSKVGDIYVYGAEGETDISAEWIRKMETSKANANRAIALWTLRHLDRSPLAAWDCSGLIVKWLLDNHYIKGDLSSRGLYAACVTVDKAGLQPGDLVYRYGMSSGLLRIHHVGVYVGDGQVVHAKGRDEGVVMEGIDQNGAEYWNRYGRLGFLK